MVLKELCHFGLKGVEKVLNEKRPFDFQIPVSRKQSAKTIKVQPQGTFLIEKDGSGGGTKNPDGRAKNHSQAVRLGPYQKTIRMCLAGFQNCFGSVTLPCLQFPPFPPSAIFKLNGLW